MNEAPICSVCGAEGTVEKIEGSVDGTPATAFTLDGPCHCLNEHDEAHNVYWRITELP